MKNKISKSRYS